MAHDPKSEGIDKTIGAQFTGQFFGSMIALSSAAIGFTAAFLSGEQDLDGTWVLRTSWVLLFTNIIFGLVSLFLFARRFNLGASKSWKWFWASFLVVSATIISFPAGFGFLIAFAWCNV